MYHNCTTEKSAAQQLLFQKCLLEIMAKQSYSEITVTSLCQATGLSRKIFYRLFDTKDDVFCAAIDQVLRRYAMEKTPSESLLDNLAEVFYYWRGQQTLLQAVAENHQMALLCERCIYFINHENRSTQKWVGAIDHPYSTEIILFFVSGIMGLIIYWHHTGYVRTPEEMARIAQELLTNPPLHLS